MSITSGFTTPLSDAVTLDQYFMLLQTGGNVDPSISTFLTNPYQYAVSTYVQISGVGDVVYENQYGNAEFVQGAELGFLPLSATRILSGGIVNGTPRTTTATIITWLAGYPY